MLKPLRTLMLVLAASAVLGCDDLATGVDMSSFQNCRVTAYQIGTTVSGTLSTSDCRLVIDGQQRDEFVDYYAFNLASLRSVTIHMASTQIDSYLILWTRAGEVIASDDDGGTGLDARIVISLPAGDYIIGATSFWDNETGNYTLSSD